MAEWFNADGRLNADAFPGWQEIATFRQEQAAYWQSLGESELSHGAAVLVENQQAGLRTLNQQVVRMQQQGQHYNQAAQHMARMFDSSEGELIGTGSKLQETRKEIANILSESAALFYIGLKRGALTLGDARDRDDILGALWEVAPALSETSALAERLKMERENARSTVRQVTAEAAAKAELADQEWRRLVHEAQRTAARWAVRRNWLWRKESRNWRDRHAASEASIKTVEATYKEHMGLAAPVDYWKNKAAQHKESEFWTRLWVLIFFPAALAGMAYAFNETGVSLINAAKEAQVPGAPPFPNAIFIVASAGLASCAGLVFWAGRLLTKLYLSQHHLRQDAEERATMTETYLALIENSAASTEDRQVILNALFRNTPDGIVKEDGGLDPSIAAALGKFLAKP
ncbi:DUF6161 domain-containing protein [Brevundimonas lenta]|uniref:DUF6161 domain-containing protein n=1 Tax=Brevundimonas lenta TaxID=424796 RepID=A0A7W6JCJ9_9CAUL|nr:DUF6161 domain-containing protein [Brevundimonas lenta]MBB4082630.1 hypothetical protein [Brevundimonas lenta]